MLLITGAIATVFICFVFFVVIFWNLQFIYNTYYEDN